MDGYAILKIPRELADEMDRWIGTRGYRSRAEIAKEAIRQFLDAMRNAPVVGAEVGVEKAEEVPVG